MKAAISLGSNLGNKKDFIENAIKKLANLPQTGVLAVSRLYRTEPVDYVDQDWFVNAVAILETELVPEKLLGLMLEIENQLGRKREILKGPRTMDLDLLLYENAISDTEFLRLPHPEMHKRSFVLVPLVSIAKDWIHPVFNKTVDQLLCELKDKSEVILLDQV